MASLSPARRAAVSVLQAVEAGHSTLATEIDRARGRLSDTRDRALLLEIAAGTLRWQASLDALLSRCSNRALHELTPAVRAILRISAYQLEHLTRVPRHAVLNDAVELTREVGPGRAAGFVNATLRTWTRTRARLRLPARPADDAAFDQKVRYLSIALSHPAWLVARWITRVGFENAETWCRFNNEPPHISVRSRKPRARDDLLDAIRTSGIDAAPARFVDDAITLPPGGLGALPPVLAETLLVQDEASQVVAHAVGAEAHERILDLCAAPGAKTVVISTDQGAAGLLVACDYRASRVRLLRRTLRTAEVPAAVVTVDATRPLPFGSAFDCVFVDVPCSGLGIIRRDPDLKWSRQPDDLAAFAMVQRRILARAADAVVPGGRLVYATCSSEPEENESVVEAFLADDSRFQLRPMTPRHAAGSAAMLVDSRGFLRTTPVAHGLDAFFAALLVKKHGVTSASPAD